MNYNAALDTPEQRTEFIAWITQTTIADLQAAAGDTAKLHEAVKRYFKRASEAGFTTEEIENMLGVDEPSIMDLAELSEADEDIVIDAFEQLATV